MSAQKFYGGYRGEGNNGKETAICPAGATQPIAIASVLPLARKQRKPVKIKIKNKRERGRREALKSGWLGATSPAEGEHWGA